MAIPGLPSAAGPSSIRRSRQESELARRLSRHSRLPNGPAGSARSRFQSWARPKPPARGVRTPCVHPRRDHASLSLPPDRTSGKVSPGRTKGAGEDRRRILIGSASLALAVFAGIGAGALVGIEDGASRLSIPALAFQTFLTVGAIPRRRGSAGLSEGLTLVALHYTVATLPLVAVAAFVGLRESLGFGLFVVAIVPPAALVPALAARLEVDVRSVLVFCLSAYSISLVLTPALLLLVIGSTVGVGGIASTVGVGLIAPSVLGRLLHERIVAVPRRVRRPVVDASVFLITFGVGGDVIDGLGSAGIGMGGVILVALVVAARSFGSGWLAARLAPRRLVAEAPLAGGFKNVALAAAVGGALLGPAAALPGLLAMIVEMVYFLVLAWQRAGAVGEREDTLSSTSVEGREQGAPGPESELSALR
jgi:hypothetical protein